MLRSSKPDRWSHGTSVERWKRSAWILRRSLAVGTFAAWVARHDGVTCGHEEKGDGGHHWWVMKGRPLRRPLQHPWRAARPWMMHIPLPRPHTMSILFRYSDAWQNRRGFTVTHPISLFICIYSLLPFLSFYFLFRLFVCVFNWCHI